MSNGWNRVTECMLCGKDRCLESTVSYGWFYCHRRNRNFHQNEINRGVKKNREGTTCNIEFDFGENVAIDHRRAISGQN